MSGSQHNPNGRQSQLGSGWSPLQLQMANLLARAPQAHMASDRGVTWHTPTPPPHLYHVPAPSPPDPLQAMKSAGSNSVFRHTATPPELYRHTPTPPDKHMMRHTPSPGDVKSGPPIPPVDIYQHLGPGRDKLMRAEELLAYARVGVDLSLGSRANGAAPPSAPAAPPTVASGPLPPAPAHSPALSVRDAPTINSLIARSGARRVDSLLERLAPAPAPAPGSAPALAPASPHSVIVHPRVQPTPSPPSSNEDSADSCGAAPGSKRKRKPERTVRVPAPAPFVMSGTPTPPAPLAPSFHPLQGPPPATSVSSCVSPAWRSEARVSSPALAPAPAPPLPPPPPPHQPAAPPPPAENGDAAHADLHPPEESPHSERHDAPRDQPPRPSEPHSDRRKTRSGSAETIADIAAMIALGGADAHDGAVVHVSPPPHPHPELSVDSLKSVLASPSPSRACGPDPDLAPAPVPASAPATAERPAPAPADRTPALVGSDGGKSVAAAPRRVGARQVAPNVPAESPSEGKAAEGEPAHAAASFVEVENQLEKMFAGLEEEHRPSSASEATAKESAPASKRRKSAPGRGREAPPRRKGPRKKADTKPRSKPARDHREGYDSGSNASSSRSRGPYIQIRGPRSSPVSVCVMNASTGEEEEGGAGGGARGRARGVRGAGVGAGERRRGLHASTLGLRYDAATRDPTWLCAFCQRAPHAHGLGDLFGPYALDADSPEYRALDDASRRRHLCEGAGGKLEAWVHGGCAVWAPGVVAAGARVWGIARAVWAAAGERCRHCTRPSGPLACAARACPQRAHLPCALVHHWRLDETQFRALCPAHADAPPPDPAPATR